ncbi:acyltransferase family protein [Xanthomonas campestris]|uniref:acyltransferase family protein n=1 Tax=Xanthomonas campestris TaxID=339 RepID=UPI000E0F7CCB|nr:acyltransferase [Xanthomonas campestris]
MHIQNSRPKIESIQALRGLGAIVVTIFHATSLYPEFNFKAGAAGVDVFFMLSGIVMYLSINPKTSPLHFLKRRVIRVIPMYWLATTLTVAYVYARHGYITPNNHLIRSYFFLPPGSFQMPLLYPGWTLNYEMLFYVILAVLLPLKKVTVPASICLIAALGSLPAPAGLVEIAHMFNPLILEFAAGLLAGIVISKGYRPTKAEATFYIFTAILLFTIHNQAQSAGVIAWGIPSALLIMGALGLEKLPLIKCKITQFSGEASYSIYLFHPFAIWAVSWMTKDQASAFAFLCAIILSITGGCLTHILVEKPMLTMMLNKKFTYKNPHT